MNISSLKNDVGSGRRGCCVVDSAVCAPVCSGFVCFNIPFEIFSSLETAPWTKPSMLFGNALQLPGESYGKSLFALMQCNNI